MPSAICFNLEQSKILSSGNELNCLCHQAKLFTFSKTSACLRFTTLFRLSKTLRKKPFQNIVGKGENAGNQHCLLFPQCFPPKLNFSCSFTFCHLQMLWIWTCWKFYHLVKREWILRIMIRCIPVTLLITVLRILLLQWFEKNIVWSTSQANSSKARIEIIVATI